MKTITHVILIIFSILGLRLNMALADPYFIQDGERIFLNSDEIFNFFKFAYAKKEFEPREGLIGVWGYKIFDSKNDKENLIFIKALIEPWFSSPRVQRGFLISHRIPFNENYDRGFCLNENTKCSYISSPVAAVINHELKETGKPIIKPEKFFFLETQIEENALIWLFDFANALESAELGEEILTDGVRFKKWPTEIYQLELLKALREDRNKYSIHSIGSGVFDDGPAGYFVRFCSREVGQIFCDPYKGLIEIRIFFENRNLVHIEAVKIAF